MRASNALALLIGLAAIGCNKPAQDQNVAIDIDSADPSDIEALPPDESSATPSMEFVIRRGTRRGQRPRRLGQFLLRRRE